MNQHNCNSCCFTGLVFLLESHFKALMIYFVDPPSNISASSDLDITAPADLTLNCSANGKPEPTITWTRLSDNTIVTMPLKITGRKDAGDYRCTADNGVGNPLTEDVSIIVLCEFFELLIVQCISNKF